MPVGGRSTAGVTAVARANPGKSPPRPGLGFVEGRFGERFLSRTHVPSTELGAGLRVEVSSELFMRVVFAEINKQVVFEWFR